MLVMDRLARRLELVHRGRRAVPARDAGARQLHAVARARPRSWSASISLVGRLAVAGAAHRLRGVRGRARSRPGAISPARSKRRPTSRSSTAAPTAMSGACSRSTSRSSTASARSASTTRLARHGPGLPGRQPRQGRARDGTAAGGRLRGSDRRRTMLETHTPRRRAADRGNARCRPACRPRPRSAR